MAKIIKGTVINMGKYSADVLKNKNGSYNVAIMKNSGSRPDVLNVIADTRDAVLDIISAFTKK